MGRNISKYFILLALIFFVVGCIEGLMFPSMFRWRLFYAGILGLPPEQLKPFFDHFMVKIHTHVALVGWVSSALMGILYFVVPQISGMERYSRWVAYVNLSFHATGLLLMTAGFHLIGFLGLRAGFAYGTAQFRAEAGVFKGLVFMGGVLVVISVLLFAWNMVRTLYADRRLSD